MAGAASGAMADGGPGVGDNESMGRAARVRAHRPDLLGMPSHLDLAYLLLDDAVGDLLQAISRGLTRPVVGAG